MSDRIAQLEHSLLELGTELFRLKHEISSLKEANEQFIRIMSGLKHILDDKGVITGEDFDSAVELGEAVRSINTGFDQIGPQIERLKKVSH